MRPAPGFLFAAFLALAGACASSITGYLRPAHLESAPAGATEQRLVHPAACRAPNGARVRFPAGSRWQPAGRLAEALVYRPLDGALTVEARHIHEVWPVVAGDRLVGLYLPVEIGLLPIEPAIPLSFEAPR